jgi:predicted acylesterase/phospholipase RssA
VSSNSDSAGETAKSSHVGPQQSSTFRILALDGGGLKGLFTAKFLSDLETDFDIRVADYFDLITGTSTGAIIAIAIGLGVPASEILQFYRGKGTAIFDAPSLGIFKTKYESEPLRNALEGVFGDRKLGHSKNRLVIPAFNIQRREVKLFKTRHSSRLLRDSKMRAVDVAMASAAAPTYLPSFIDDSRIEYVDGGVWANNPALVGLIEAMTVLQIDRSNIRLLSIGTTREVNRMDSISAKAGRAQWVPQLSDVFIGADMVAADAMCEHLLRDDPDGDSTRYFRINPVVAKDEFTLDQFSANLIALAAREAEHSSRKLRDNFFGEKAIPFEPHTNHQP